MSKKSTNPEADQLRQLIQDAASTTGQVDTLESELIAAQHALRDAASLEEVDGLTARVEELKAELNRAHVRADMAETILNRDGFDLEQAALRKATEAVVTRHGPESIELDRAIVATATQLLDLFGQRRELEARCHTEILADAPQRPGSLGIGHLHAHGIPQRGNHIVRYTQALYGVDESFS